MKDINMKRLYMDDVGKYPLLTKEEAEQLHIQAKKGDKEAREKLINSNLRLVISIANTYVGCGLDYMDLIQQGNIGLINAVDNWDPNLGTLSTFATFKIRASISRYCYNNIDTIRKPVWQKELSYQIDKTIENFILISGRKPSVDEIAAILDIYPEKIEKIYQDNSVNFIPLDAPVSDDSNAKIEETIADESPDEFEADKMKKAVEVALSFLEPDEREILENSFGLNGKCKTQEQMAMERGCTKQNMSLKKLELIQKLRYPEILDAIRKEL